MCCSGLEAGEQGWGRRPWGGQDPGWVCAPCAAGRRGCGHSSRMAGLREQLPRQTWVLALGVGGAVWRPLFWPVCWPGRRAKPTALLGPENKPWPGSRGAGAPCWLGKQGTARPRVPRKRPSVCPQASDTRAPAASSLLVHPHSPRLQWGHCALGCQLPWLHATSPDTAPSGTVPCSSGTVSTGFGGSGSQRCKCQCAPPACGSSSDPPTGLPFLRQREAFLCLATTGALFAPEAQGPVSDSPASDTARPHWLRCGPGGPGWWVQWGLTWPAEWLGSCIFWSALACPPSLWECVLPFYTRKRTRDRPSEVGSC